MNPWRSENAASNSHNHEHQLVVCECDCDSESVYGGGRDGGRGGGVLSLDRLGGSSQYSYLSRSVVWWDIIRLRSHPERSPQNTHARTILKTKHKCSPVHAYIALCKCVRTIMFPPPTFTHAHTHKHTFTHAHQCKAPFSISFSEHNRHKDALILI